MAHRERDDARHRARSRCRGPADRPRRRRPLLAFGLSYKARPSLGSILHAQELPAEGGDTLFANQHLAWETLPKALKSRVEGLKAEHSYLAKYEELRARNPWRPKLSQAQIDELRGRIPLGALGNPADVAAAARFLVGPSARYITGHVLAVDGGMAM